MLTDFMQMAHIMVGNVIPKAKAAEDRAAVGGVDDDNDFEVFDGNYATVHCTIGGAENAAAGTTSGAGGAGGPPTLKARNTG